MKNGQVRSIQGSLSDHLLLYFPIDPRRLTVLSALILAVIQARSVVLYQLVQVVDLPGSDDTLYKRLKRFVQFALSDLLIARFVLEHLRDEQQLLLVLDRTNWKLGERDINILLLSVQWNTFTFPLVWTLLDHSGNSNMSTRVALVERISPFLHSKRILLTADREFIGADWFVALRRLGISPVIRLRADSRVNGVPVRALFNKLQPGECRVWHRSTEVYGVQLRILACKKPLRDTLYLAYQGYAKAALKSYALRWTTENMFQAFKSRGFFLERTHLTNPARVSTLFAIIALAFVWCCLAGEFEEQRAPLSNLKHGYPPKSLFRRGLDVLRTLLNKKKRGTRKTFFQYLATFVP